MSSLIPHAHEQVKIKVRGEALKDLYTDAAGNEKKRSVLYGRYHELVNAFKTREDKKNIHLIADLTLRNFLLNLTEMRPSAVGEALENASRMEFIRDHLVVDEHGDVEITGYIWFQLKERANLDANQYLIDKCDLIEKELGLCTV
jgi:hypothetical protein